MITASPELLADVIGSIYDAAYGPATWGVAVGKLDNLFHASKACFGRSGPDLQANDVVATNIDPVFTRLFFEEHADAQNEFGEALSAAPVGRVYSDHALVGENRLRHSRFWNEWMAPQDMYGGLGCKLLESGSSFWYVDIQRGSKQAAFETADAELLRVIAPHLARAAEIRRQFQSTRVLTSAFSHLPFGVVVLDGDMRIVTSNAAAEAILLRSESVLLRKSGCLVAADARHMAVLQNLVTQACGIRGDVIPGIGGDLLIKRRGVGVDIALSVGPLVNTLEEIPFLGRHAVIFIREISLDLPAGFAEQVRAFFDLTPKEAVLAASLASGLTLKQAAEDAHIRFSTARSHLEKIFLKTETRQQSQLVALLKSVQTMARKSEG